jgi:hypothetical protein
VGKLWPPSYRSDQQQVGAFLIRFEFADSDAQTDGQPDDDWMYYPSTTEVIPLDEKVLRRKLESPQ